MITHHTKHHAGYVKKLNSALSNHKLKGKSLEDIMLSIENKSDDLSIRNNGGGHYNHSLFWEIMKPGGSNLTQKLDTSISKYFGSFDLFKEEFKKTALSQFGSGWAWLNKDDSGNLFISSTPNQDNPLMKNIVEKSGKPILGIDVWEHAYYLKYQNKRGEYIENFFNVIDWKKVEENLG